VERPGEVIDDGLARLCQAVTAQPADAACATVMAALVGSEPARDDIALLMFWRSPPNAQQSRPQRLRSQAGRPGCGGPLSADTHAPGAEASKNRVTGKQPGSFAAPAHRFPAQG
jgi:hypothetical protein